MSSYGSEVSSIYRKPTLGTQRDVTADKTSFDNNGLLVLVYNRTKTKSKDQVSKKNIKGTTPLRVWGKIQNEVFWIDQPTACTSLIPDTLQVWSLESGTPASTQQACQSPVFMIGQQESLCNAPSLTETWGILVDTGAATSVAPQSFAHHLELSPAPPTLKLTTATGKAVKIFGLRHVHLQCQDLILRVSFVIADVVTPLLGMDMIFQHNLSLIFEHGQSFLVNKAGKRTQLQPKGEHLYLVACPFQHGLSTCSRGSLPEPIGFLPEDKELHEQTVALQSSSSTDLVEDRSFPEPLHVHDKSSFVCLLCEEKGCSFRGRAFAQ